jgi:hypothetical protein
MEIIQKDLRPVKQQLVILRSTDQIDHDYCFVTTNTRIALHVLMNNQFRIVKDLHEEEPR